MGKKTSRGLPKSSNHAKAVTASRKYAIQNKLGLHARAAALFVKVASQFRSEIKVKKGSQEVNGKSIMGILMLAASQGSEVSVAAEGEDADQAIHELGKLIENHFGEK